MDQIPIEIVEVGFDCCHSVDVKTSVRMLRFNCDMFMLLHENQKCFRFFDSTLFLRFVSNGLVKSSSLPFHRRPGEASFLGNCQ
jgi:hypothetical protein